MGKKEGPSSKIGGKKGEKNQIEVKKKKDGGKKKRNPRFTKKGICLPLGSEKKEKRGKGKGGVSA